MRSTTRARLRMLKFAIVTPRITKLDTRKYTRAILQHSHQLQALQQSVVCKHPPDGCMSLE